MPRVTRSPRAGVPRTPPGLPDGLFGGASWRKGISSSGTHRTRGKDQESVMARLPETGSELRRGAPLLEASAGLGTKEGGKTNDESE